MYFRKQSLFDYTFDILNQYLDFIDNESIDVTLINYLFCDEPMSRVLSSDLLYSLIVYKLDEDYRLEYVDLLIKIWFLEMENDAFISSLIKRIIKKLSTREMNMLICKYEISKYSRLWLNLDVDWKRVNLNNCLFNFNLNLNLANLKNNSVDELFLKTRIYCDSQTDGETFLHFVSSIDQLFQIKCDYSKSHYLLNYLFNLKKFKKDIDKDIYAYLINVLTKEKWISENSFIIFLMFIKLFNNHFDDTELNLIIKSLVKHAKIIKSYYLFWFYLKTFQSLSQMVNDSNYFVETIKSEMKINNCFQFFLTNEVFYFKIFLKFNVIFISF